MARVRLAIGVPTTGFTRIEWVESVLEMQKALMADRNLKVDHVVVLYFCSSVIPKNRMRIVDMARRAKCTHILWIDDDMRFPPIAAKALIKGMQQNPEMLILGANCIKRKYPIEWMASQFDDTEVKSWGKHGIEQVRYTGNSFVLVNMKVYDIIPKPWYAFAWHNHSEDFGTEDVFFMEMARQHGINTYIDHDVSQLIHHIGINVFKPEELKVVLNVEPVAEVISSPT